MAGLRTNLGDFGLANPLYSGAIVRVYTVDPDTQTATTNYATLYEDVYSSGTLSNPQTLDGEGKWQQPVYVDRAVVLDITTSGLATHQTGITGVIAAYRGDWAADATYVFGDTVRDGAAGDNTKNIYLCITNHTAGADWTTDLTVGKWQLYIDVDVGIDFLPLTGGTVTGAVTIGTGTSTPLTVAGSALITGGLSVTGSQSQFNARVVVTEAGVIPTLIGGGMGYFSAGQALPTRVIVDCFEEGTSAGYIVRRANGTESAPTAIQNLDQVGGIQARGYGASGYSTSRAEMRFVAAENWTDTAQGTRIEFATSNIGVAVLVHRMTINPSGRVKIGNATSDDGVNMLQVDGPVTVTTGNSYKVNNVAVVGARKTGWGTATGTATRTTFATGSVTLSQLAERVKALIDDLHETAGHGLIGA